MKIEDKSILEETVNMFGSNVQFVKALEELGELSTAISRMILQPNGLMHLSNLVEELADVFIMINQIEYILENEYDVRPGEIQRQINFKLERLDRYLYDIL